jgi:hypothetical protein
MSDFSGSENKPISTFINSALIQIENQAAAFTYLNVIKWKGVK